MIVGSGGDEWMCLSDSQVRRGCCDSGVRRRVSECDSGVRRG